MKSNSLESRSKEGTNISEDRKPRSSTKGSANSDLLDGPLRSEQLLPRPEGGNKDRGLEEVRVDAANPKKGDKARVGAGQNEISTNTSPENSGSGENFYSTVKAVPEKEECAYSVVELASKDTDTEYELIDGKLIRREKSLETKKVEPIEYNDYELVGSLPAPMAKRLDPVVFAIENSGSSGIYEYMPDSKVQVQATPNKAKEHSGSEDQHQEQKTKKWGLTRFSMKGKNKTKTEQATDKNTPSHHIKGSPKIGAESPTTKAKKENTNNVLPDVVSFGQDAQERKSRQSSFRGAAAPHDDGEIPPPPPIENLRLKVDHRKTIHVTDPATDMTHSRVTPRRPSAPEVMALEGRSEFRFACNCFLDYSLASDIGVISLSEGVRSLP